MLTALMMVSVFNLSSNSVNAELNDNVVVSSISVDESHRYNYAPEGEFATL